MEPTKAQLLEENAQLVEFAEAVHDLACEILGVEDEQEPEEDPEEDA